MKEHMQKKIWSFLVLMGVIGGVGIAFAATENVPNKSGGTTPVEYEGATVTPSGNARIFTFTSGTGKLTVPANAKADFLVVGGGGGGASANYTSIGSFSKTHYYGYGTGGNGGTVTEEISRSFAAQTLAITVGSAGTVGKIGSSQASSGTISECAGGVGGTSSVTGSSSFTAISAAGGSGGTTTAKTGTPSNNSSAGTPTTGTTSAITSEAYGKGGARAGTSAGTKGTNPGDGGQGGGISSSGSSWSTSYTGYLGGAGAAGIVIVRITEIEAPKLTVSFAAGALAANHVSVKSVTVNGTGVSVAKSYKVDAGANMVFTFQADEGYVFVAADTLTLANVQSDTTIAASEIPATREGSLLPHEVEYKCGNLKTVIGYDGATVTTNGPNDDLIFTFSDPNKASAIQFMRPNLYNVEFLAVGGGGAGGTQSKMSSGAGGGGAGGYQSITTTAFTAGMYYIQVGAGGKKADSRISSVNGNPGGDSFVTNATGMVLASAVGGGGGGASRDDGTGGSSGGSGGGGAWAKSVATHGGSGAGGTGRDGQGNDGGTPTYRFYGAGGGGAGGVGGSDKQALGGVGLTNSITGRAVEYARGGDGGHDDTIAEARDGVTPGSGGNGGNGGIGGSGADGIVIVRVSKMYKNIQIQKPSVLNGGLNTEGPTTLAEDGSEPMSQFVYDYKTMGNEKTCVSPNFDAKVVDQYGDFILKPDSTTDYLTYHDVTNYIQGISTARAWAEEVTPGSNVVHGIAHYQFTVHLKEGYTWVDEKDPEYGSSKGCLVEWRITDSLSTVDATISVEKIVDWDKNGGSNATITVSAYATPKQVTRTPKVLFLGTLCSYHSLTPYTIGTSINTIAAKADVDWFLLMPTSASESEKTNYDRSGSAAMGTKVFEVSGSATSTSSTATEIATGKTVNMNNSRHQALERFLRTIITQKEALAARGEAYDYVIMEFDGSRLFPDYNPDKSGNDELEQKTADYLKPFYEDGRMIWIVDNNSNNETWNFPDGKQYCRPMSYCVAGPDYDNNATVRQYAALLALLDPKHYVANATSFDQLTNQHCTSITCTRRSAGTVTGDFYANDRYENQIVYDNCEAVQKFLEEHIKPVPYGVTYGDQVKMNVGLSLTYAEYFVTTNSIATDAPETKPQEGDWSGWWRVGSWTPGTGACFTNGYDLWKDLVPKNFGTIDVSVTTADPSSNIVTFAMENMLCETRGKMVIHIVDDGKFKTTADAVFNPVTGEWEKDPNNGKARVVMSINGQETEVEGSAATSAAWSFKTFWITTSSVNGQVFLNGMYTNRLGFSENYNPEVAYRGKPGYTISELKIDNVVQELDATNSVRTVFYKIASNHKVAVTYTNYVKSITATPTEDTYDGYGHVFKVEPEFIPGVEYEYEVRYSMNGEEGTYLSETDFLEANRATLKNVGDHDFYYKVFALQPGWGEELDDWGWVEISTPTLIGEGVCTNTITARDLWITAESREIKYNDPMPTDLTVTYQNFVEGETNTTALAGTLKFDSTYYKGASVGWYPITPSGLENKEYPNYAIHFMQGQLNVGKSGFVVDGVPQTPSLDPNLAPYTGVPRVEKTYDGEPTSIVVNVTFPTDTSKYEIKYSTNTNDVNSWSTTLPLFTNHVEDVRVWYALESEVCFAYTNYQYVTVNKRPVTLLSASAKKQFDGYALTTNEIAVLENETSMGFAKDEGLDRADVINTRCTTSLSKVAVTNNAYIYKLKTNTRASNYTITELCGTLELTPGQMIIGSPDDPESQVEYPVDTDKAFWPDPGSNGVENVTNVYSGAGSRIVVNVIRPATGFTIQYSGDGETWSDDFAFTNVVDSGRAIFFSVVDDQGNYAPVTNRAFVTILPKAASVTPTYAERVYNGEEFRSSAFTQADFVSGEGIEDVTMTGGSVIMNTGTNRNVIAELKPMVGTDLTNYAITTNDNDLVVTPKALTITPADQAAKWDDVKSSLPYKYDVTAAGAITAVGYVSGEEFTYTSPTELNDIGSKLVEIECHDNGKSLTGNYTITVDEAYLTIGTTTIQIGGSNTPMTPVEDGTNGVRSVVTVYDGNPHAISVKVTYPVKDATERIRYAVSEAFPTAWPYETSPEFTNVCDKVRVWYAVDITGYDSVTNYAFVTITNRPVTVTAKDKEMTYGDAEKPTLDFDLANGVSGDVFTVPLGFTNETFNAGVYPGAILTNGDITVASEVRGEVTDCYDVTFKAGQLTVNQATMTVKAEDVVKTYDGNPTNAVVVPSVPSCTIEYQLPGGEWTNELALVDAQVKGGKVVPYAVTYRVVETNGNYSTVTGAVNVTINPRKITVKACHLEAHISTVIDNSYTNRCSVDIGYADGQPMDPTLEATLKKTLAYKFGIDGEMKVGEADLTVNGERYQGNYEIEYIWGKIEIYDTELVKYEVTGVTNCYDATVHKIKVKVLEPSGEGDTIVYYGDSDGDDGKANWRDWNSATGATSVAESGIHVYFKIVPQGTAAKTYKGTVSYSTVVVTQKVVTVTAVSETVNAGDTPVLETKIGGMVEGEPESLITFTKDTTYDPATAKPNDTYPFTVSGTASQGNYYVLFENGTITVSGLKKVKIGGKGPFGDKDLPPEPPEDRRDTGDPTGTGVKNVVKTYDAVGTNVTVTATDADDGTKKLDVFFMDDKGEWVKQLDYVNVGTNKVWYKVDTEGYCVVSNYAYVVIDPAPVTVTADNQMKTYGASDPAFTMVTNGLFGTDTIIHTVSREDGEDVGNYAIKPTGDERQENYTVSYVNGNLEIVPAPMPSPDEKPDEDPPYDPEKPGPQNPPSPEGPSGQHVELSDYDVVEMYDGTGWTVDAAAIRAKANEKTGNAVTNLEFSVDGTAWQAKPFVYTNVVSTSFWYRVGASNYSNFYHAAGVTVTNRVVGFKAVDKSSKYGAPIVELTYVTNLCSVVKGDTVSLTLKTDATSASPVSGSPYPITTNGTVTVTTPDFAGSNYLVQFTDGEYTIEEDDGFDFDFTDDATKRIYKAEGWEPPVEAKNKEGAPIAASEYKVEYGDNVHATNHVEDASGAWAIVTMTNNYSGSLKKYFTILKKPLTVTTPGTNFVYKGESQQLKQVSYDGLVEGKDYVVTNSFASIKDVKDSGAKNKFTYTLAGIVRDGDYDVTENWGTLNVVPAKPPLPEEDDPVDPPPAPPEEDDPYVPPAPQDDPEGDILTFSDYDYVGMYDGDYHTFLTNALMDVIRQQVQEGRWIAGNEPKVSYSVNGAKDSWVKDPFEFKNVVSTGFWYKVSCESGNYSNVIHAIGLTITNRVVEFKAEDKTSTYGEKLADLTYVTNLNSVVEGDIVHVREFLCTTATSTSPISGSPYPITTNGLVYVTTPDFEGSNYKVVFTPGEYTLTASTFNFTLDTYNNSYDGNSHVVSANIADEKVRSEAAVWYHTGDGIWSEKQPAFTDVTNVTVYVKVTTDNYGEQEGFAELSIKPRKIVFTCPSDSKSYDGQPLQLDESRLTIGGQEYAPGECFRYEFPKITEIGSIPSVVECFDNGKAKVSNYEIKVTEGNTLTITPSKDEIGVTSKSYQWPYDGNAHWLKEYETSNLDNLIPGDELSVTLEGTQITYPGCTNNAILSVRVLRNNKDVTEAYDNIVTTTGTLTVVNAKFTGVTACGVSRKYDGTPTNILVTVKEPLAPNPTIEYSVDGTSWVRGNPTFKDTGTYTVHYKVTAPYFDDFTGTETVQIDPREVTFTSPSDTAVYHDGIELSTDVANIKVAGDGLVEGERAGITFTSTKTLTAVGQDEATFTYAFDEKIAKSRNYTVTPAYGTLEIFPQNMLVVTSGSEEFEYDGDEHKCMRVTFDGELKTGDTLSVTYLKSITYPRESAVANDITVKVFHDDREVTDEYTIKTVSGELTMKKLPFEGLVSAKDAVKVYDGVATNILVKVDETKLIEGATYAIEYKKSAGDPWNKTSPSFVQGGTDQTVSYQVTSDDYETFRDSAKVEIALRQVKLVSGSDSKAYDGTPLVKHEVTVVEGDGLYGPAAGEYFDFTVTGEAKEIGTFDNLFDCAVTNAAGAKDLAINYHLEKVPGKLTVTPAQIPFTLDGFEGPYDGLPHMPVLEIGDLPAGGTPVKSFSTDGGKTWKPEPPSFTDVTNVTVLVKIEIPNYETVSVTTEIDVQPRELLLVAPDLKRAYDGKELTFTGDDIQDGGQLYATGECFRYYDFASIIEVGRIKSTFKYDNSEDGKTKVSNYKVTIVPNRWLEILPDASRIVVRSLSYYGVYDGESHTGATVENPDGFEIIDNGNLVPGDRVVAVLDGKTVKYPSDGIVSNTFASVEIMRGEETVTKSYTNLVEVIGTLEVVPADFSDGDIEAVGIDRKYDGTTSAVVVTVKNELAKDTAKVVYSTDGVNFGEDVPTFKNACDETVTYIVTDANFNPYTNSVTAKISKRTVCFKSKNDWKFYDGEPLTVKDENIVQVAGYDGFVEGEGYEKFDKKASITQKGSCEATFEVVLKEGTLAENYKIETVFGELSIYWSDGLIIVAGSQEFAFDGEEHVCHSCEYLHVDEGDTLQTNGFEYVGSISRPDQSPVANWIRRESVKVVDGKGKDVTAKYGEFVLIAGELTMEKLTLDALVSAEDVEKVYDGEPTQITVVVDASKLPPAVRSSVKIRYSSLPNAGFGEKNPTRTKAGTQDVYYYVSADGCADSQVKKATISISTRKVQLVSEGAAKTYDGDPLVTNEVFCAKGEGLHELAKGDFLDYRCYGSQTDVGDSENRFDFAITNAAKDVSLKDNYFVTFDYGKLVVTPAEQETEDPEDPPEGALTPYDYIGVYDGNPHTITPFRVTKPADAKIFYSTNGMDWFETKFLKTDVCRLEKIWFKSVARNYDDVVTNGFVTITNRPVTVRSADGSYVYDGKTHVTNAFTVTSGSFAGVEGISAVNWAGITTVAESGKENSFTEVWNSETKASNYLFVKEYGTLTMVPGSPEPPEGDEPGKNPPKPPKPDEPPFAPPAPQDPVSSEIGTFSDYDYVEAYDGEAHTLLTNDLLTVIADQVKAGKWPGVTPEVSYSLTGKTWVPDPFEFTDVVSTGFWYRVSCTGGNFSNVVHAVGVTITQRVVKVEFPMAVKNYDKTIDYAKALETNVVRATHNMIKEESFHASAWGKFDKPDEGDRGFILTNVTFAATEAHTKFSNYKLYFGNEGKVLFEPDGDLDAPGPHSFGPDDTKWPPDEDRTVPGKIVGLYHVRYLPGCTSYSGSMPVEDWTYNVPTNLMPNAYVRTSGDATNFLGWATNGVDLVFGDGQRLVNLTLPGLTKELTAVWTDSYVVYGNISGDYADVRLWLVPVGAKDESEGYEATVLGTAPNQAFIILAPALGEYDLVAEFAFASGMKTKVTQLVDVKSARTRVDVVAPSGDWNSFVNNEQANGKWNTIASYLDVMATNNLTKLISSGAKSTEIELVVTDKPVDKLKGDEIRQRRFITKAATTNDVDQLCNPERIVETFDLTVIRRTTYTNEYGEITHTTTNYPGRANDEEEVIARPVRMLIPFDLEGRTDFWVYRCHYDVHGEPETIPLDSVPELATDMQSEKEGWALLNERTEGGKRYFVVQSKKFSMFGIGYRGAKLAGVANGLALGIDWTGWMGDGTYYGSLKLQNYDGWPQTIKNLRILFPTRYHQGKKYAILGANNGRGRYPEAPGGIVDLANVFTPVAQCEGETVVWGLTEYQKTHPTSVTLAQLPPFALYIYNGVKPADVTVAELLSQVTYESYGWTNTLSFVSNPALQTVVTAANRSLQVTRGAASALSAGALSKVNAAMAYNISVDEIDDVSCRVSGFTVSENSITGEVTMETPQTETSPGVNAEIRLLGSPKLGEPFVDLGPVEVRDGRFDVPIPEGYEFFKVKVNVIEVVK